MEAWPSAMELLQLHLQELDAAAGKQPAASSPPITATMLRANVDRLVGTELSRTVVGQMLQAEVRISVTERGCCCFQVGPACTTVALEGWECGSLVVAPKGWPTLHTYLNPQGTNHPHSRLTISVHAVLSIVCVLCCTFFCARYLYA